MLEPRFRHGFTQPTVFGFHRIVFRNGLRPLLDPAPQNGSVFHREDVRGQVVHGQGDELLQLVFEGQRSIGQSVDEVSGNVREPRLGREVSRRCRVFCRMLPIHPIEPVLVKRLQSNGQSVDAHFQPSFEPIRVHIFRVGFQGDLPAIRGVGQ